MSAVKATVAVTGITGYIGSQIAQDLLDRGHIVHGTLRKKTSTRIAHLSEPTAGALQVFEADLCIAGSFDAAIAGCDYVLHVASPVVVEVRHPERELIRPAVDGTLNVLRSSKKHGVKRVVLTSSLGAVYGRGEQGRVFTEHDWNGISSATYMPYFYSKMCAERASWAFAEENALDLVVINPGYVMGSSLVPQLNESWQIIKHVAEGTVRGIVDIQIPIVDVRDVSEAHIRAMQSPQANGRYICATSENLTSVRDITMLLRTAGFKPPMWDISSALMTHVLRQLVFIVPGGYSAQWLREHLGRPVVVDSTKIRKDLGISFRDPEETVRETIDELVKGLHLERPS